MEMAIIPSRTSINTIPESKIQLLAKMKTNIHTELDLPVQLAETSIE